ncbi:MAG: hypothetical protein ACR2OZ_04230 [Verrucomicrobiales bacterium]
MADDPHSASRPAANAIPPFPVTSLPPVSPFAPEPQEPAAAVAEVGPGEEPGVRSIDLSKLPRQDLFAADFAPLPLPLGRWTQGNGPTVPPPVLPTPLPPAATRVHPPALPAPVSQGRYWLLSLGGVAVLVFGFVLAAPLPLALAGKHAAALANWRSSLPLLLDHLLVPVALIILGLGSVFARRWARHLLLGLATIAFAWLLALVTAKFLFALRDGRLPRDPGELASVALTVLGALAFPWVVIALYSSRQSRLACEISSPPCWTDRLPEAAVILAVSCALLARFFAARLFDAPFPFFGGLLDDGQAELGWLTAAGLFLLASLAHIWSWVAGWWLALVSGLGVGISFVWTVFAGPAGAVERWWKFKGIGAGDAGVLVAALFVLWLLLLGSLARHLRPPAHDPR